MLVEQLPDEVAEPAPGKRPDRNDVDFFHGEKGGEGRAAGGQKGRHARKVRVLLLQRIPHPSKKVLICRDAQQLPGKLLAVGFLI